MPLTTTLFGKKNQEVSTSLTPTQGQEQLEKAEPAERRGVPRVYSGASAGKVEYPYLDLGQRKDGVWVCCCGDEKPLVHFQGAFPFKHLKCGKCDHVLCERCETTGIVAVLQDNSFTAMLDETGVRVFQICPSCGLSHRAVEFEDCIYWVPSPSYSHPGKCSCGAPAKPDWIKCAIGEPWVYREDPVEAVHECKTKQMEDKVQRDEAKLTYRAQDYSTPLTHHSRKDSLRKQAKPRRKRPESLRKRPASLFVQTHSPSGDSDDSVQNTPVSSKVPSVIPRVQCQTKLTVNTQACSLKRSGAHRGRDSRPYTPRSASWNNYLSPALPRPALIDRSVTWAPATIHQQVNNHAEASMKSVLGTTKYEAAKPSTKGELSLEDIRNEICDDTFTSKSHPQEPRSFFDPYEEDSAYARAGIDRIKKLVPPLPLSQRPLHNDIYGNTKVIRRKPLFRSITNIPPPVSAQV